MILRSNYAIFKLIFFFLASLSTVLQASVLEETWYRIDLGGAPAGWMVERENHHDDRFISESELHLEIRRGSELVLLKMASRVVETADGRALEAWSRQELGAMPVETFYIFGAEHVAMTVQQNGEAREEQLPHPAGEWLTPGAAHRALNEHLAADLERFTLRTLDPLVGIEPVSTEWTLEARQAEAEIDGNLVTTTRWRQVQNVAPEMPAIADLDAEGRLVRSTARMMGLEMTITRSTRARAKGALNAQRDAGLPELLVRTFVRPDQPIANPRTLRRKIYEVRRMDGTAPALPSTGAQHAVIEAERHATRVVVDLDAPAGPSSAELSPSARAALTATSTWLDHRDPAIRELLKRVDGALAPAARAEALRRLVHGHLQEKDLGTALATATEVAATRTGDCTEHSVLLTALLRAADIPARVAAGLIYVERFAGADEIFAYHMWSQAWLDGRWIDLDATLPEPFDAAHIALGTARLADSDAWIELGALAVLIGDIQIRIVDDTPHEPSATAPQDSPEKSP